MRNGTKCSSYLFVIA